MPFSDFDPLASVKGYSQDTFYTGSGGRESRSTLQVHVPSGLLDLMAHARSVIPQYRSNADIVRDALTHRLHHLGSDDFPALRRKVEAWEHAAELPAVRAAQDAAIEMRDALQSLMLHAGTEAEAERARAYIREQARLTADKAWADTYRAIASMVTGF